MEVFLFVLVTVMLYAVNEYQKEQREQRSRVRISKDIYSYGDTIRKLIEQNYTDIRDIKTSSGKLDITFKLPFNPIIESWHTPSQFLSIKRRFRLTWERIPGTNCGQMQGYLHQNENGKWRILSTNEVKVFFDAVYQNDMYFDAIEKRVACFIRDLVNDANDDLGVLSETHQE